MAMSRHNYPEKRFMMWEILYLKTSIFFRKGQFQKYSVSSCSYKDWWRFTCNICISKSSV